MYLSLEQTQPREKAMHFLKWVVVVLLAILHVKEVNGVFFTYRVVLNNTDFTPISMYH